MIRSISHVTDYGYQTYMVNDGLYWLSYIFTSSGAHESSAEKGVCGRTSIKYPAYALATGAVVKRSQKVPKVYPQPQLVVNLQMLQGCLLRCMVNGFRLRMVVQRLQSASDSRELTCRSPKKR